MDDDRWHDICLRPPWLQDQPAIVACLHNVLDKLDKNPEAVPGFTISKKSFPDLFIIGERSDLMWDSLQTILKIKPEDTQFRVFSYKENKKRKDYDPEYSGARIKFLADAEDTLRLWLKRPFVESNLQHWKNTVQRYKTYFPGAVDRLRARQISVKQKTADEVIQGFIKISEYLNQELTLRNLSACCFWQDSKFLDGKDEIVTQLYPRIKIKARPVMVSVFLPEKIRGVLFVENQDSYTQAMAGMPEIVDGMALVYSSGFKASAQRIREPEGVSLHFSEHSHQQNSEKFRQWWTTNSDNQWPVYFWGDLDYSGMDILANLKQRFDCIVAWQPGYLPMLESLLIGEGHEAQSTGKQLQKDPFKTGCHFADTKLLPALRQHQRFIDQEWLC